jgi:hypothetical protein
MHRGIAHAPASRLGAALNAIQIAEVLCAQRAAAAA